MKRGAKGRWSEGKEEADGAVVKRKKGHAQKGEISLSLSPRGREKTKYESKILDELQSRKESDTSPSP